MSAPALATAAALPSAPAPASASLEPLVQSLKDQSARFRDTFDQWCAQQQQSTEQEQVVHRDVMKQAEGTAEGPEFLSLTHTLTHTLRSLSELSLHI